MVEAVAELAVSLSATGHRLPLAVATRRAQLRRATSTSGTKTHTTRGANFPASPHPGGLMKK